VTGRGLKELAGLSQLRSLNLWYTGVKGDARAELQKALPHLRIHP
jgi:hypothetical protein